MKNYVKKSHCADELVHCTLYSWRANASFRYSLTQLCWLSLFLIWANWSDLWLQNYVQSKLLLEINTIGLRVSVCVRLRENDSRVSVCLRLRENDSRVIINHWANGSSLSPLTHHKKRFGLSPINGIMNDHFISTHILTQFEFPVFLSVCLAIGCMLILSIKKITD